MTKQELQKIFESPFDWDNWRKVMDFVFPEFNFSAQKIPLEQFTKAAEEQIEGFYHHGSTSLVDHITLNLYEVELKGSVNLPLNIKGIRKFIANEAIANTQVSIAVFYSPDKSKWRFTLAVKQMDENFIEIDRKPDSYTYVFGKGERGRTASECFFNLSTIADKKLKDLEDAFSVEALSKKFFNQYKIVYKQFVDNIVDNPSRLNLFKSNEIAEQEKMARDFVKKMMGRIVFLYFLQKKGWMGCKTKWQQGDGDFMQSLFNNAGQDNPLFYSHYLQPLFFDTLNAKRTAVDEDCIIAGFNLGKVPFLNGGLFEREESHPDSLTLDWDIFHTLFEILNNYNFTIIEDDPEFKEVAVDPEMLGHIFENLLEENRNKTGAFYTPKEIVQYMCQESLIEYLNTQLSKKIEAKGLKEAIRDFVLKQHFVGLNDINQQSDKYVLQALRDIKVCDPAIGSGAFPMGILHEIFRIVEALEDRDIFQSIWEMDRWNAAKVKEDIIQSSIYGVDIEKGAVDIARLRFWLSIIIDEEVPKPLPNLDYKIMQGNSLLEQYEGIQLNNIQKTKNVVYSIEGDKQMKMFSSLSEGQISFDVLDDKLESLENSLNEYFISTNPEKKLLLKKKINKIIHDHLHFNIDLLKGKHEIMLAESQSKLKIIRIDKHDSEAKRKQKEKKLIFIGSQIEVLEREIKRLEAVLSDMNLLQETDNRPYFLWHLMFRDVFDQGGFDVVIGNPPYIQLQKMGKAADDLQKAGYETFTRTGDIYCLFFELGNRLLKKDGNLNFITSNSWLRANYGKITREYFLNETTPIQLIDLSDSEIFETATVRTSIFQFKKSKNPFRLNATRITRKKQAALNNFRKYLLENSIILESLTEDAWVINSKEKKLIIDIVRGKGKKLVDWDINMFRGIITGLNEAFVLTDLVKKQLISEDQNSENIIKPFLRGKDLSRYSISFKQYHLINSHNGLKLKKLPAIDVLNDYPSIYRHLVNWEDKLIKRADQGDHWSNLRNCAYLEEFEKPKLIYPNMITHISFTYDDSGYFTNQKCYIMTGEKLKFLLGLLNSKLFRFCFEEEFPEVQGNAREINKVVFETIPLKYPNANEESLIEQKVNEVLKLKEQGKDSTEVEKEIDYLIYKMYDLSYEQVLTIENDFALSEEEYKNLSLADLKA